jgi:hypothetical protein
MDKYLIKPTSIPDSSGSHKSTLELLDDLPAQKAVPISLGVLGSSQDSFWNQNTISDTILNPVLADLGRLPDSMLLPTDGASSLLLQVWGEKQKIPLTCLDADWAKLGKKARALRDARILKESTHLLLFLGKRSDTYEKIAIRECKKGKIVYTIDTQSKELVEWRLEA